MPRTHVQSAAEIGLGAQHLANLGPFDAPDLVVAIIAVQHGGIGQGMRHEAGFEVGVQDTVFPVAGDRVFGNQRLYFGLGSFRQIPQRPRMGLAQRGFQRVLRHPLARPYLTAIAP